MPMIQARKKPVAAVRSASLVSWRPRVRAMVLPLPWPRVKPTAWMMVISGYTTLMAPVAEVLLSRPMKKVSAMLYRLVTSMLMMLGTAMRSISRRMGVSVIMAYFRWAVMGLGMLFRFLSFQCEHTLSGGPLSMRGGCFSYVF